CDFQNHALRRLPRGGSTLDTLLGTGVPVFAEMGTYWEKEKVEGAAVRPHEFPRIHSPHGLALDPLAGDPSLPGDFALSCDVGLRRGVYFASTPGRRFGRDMLPGRLYTLAGIGDPFPRRQEEAGRLLDGGLDLDPRAVGGRYVGFPPGDGPLLGSPPLPRSR